MKIKKKYQSMDMDVKRDQINQISGGFSLQGIFLFSFRGFNNALRDDDE